MLLEDLSSSESNDIFALVVGDTFPMFELLNGLLLDTGA
jgi:hypothetical protein